jgi:hypothetical protein
VRVRSAAVTVLLLVLTACGGGTGASAPPPTSASDPGGTPAGTAAASSAVVDLSGVDACTLLDEATVAGLTGESGFDTDQNDNTHCFWGVPRPGVPQYVDINLFARPTGLAGYNFDPGTGCTLTPVAGAGTEAMGATCDNPQHKVHLLAWDRGVAVQILVNEPKGALTPADLAAAARAALEKLE